MCTSFDSQGGPPRGRESQHLGPQVDDHFRRCRGRGFCRARLAACGRKSTSRAARSRILPAIRSRRPISATAAFPLLPHGSRRSSGTLSTPQNMYDLEMSLVDRDGQVLDTFYPQRFGFREFWIEGRDFYLNGSRFHSFIVPCDNPLHEAASATYEAARETLLRDRSIGVNTVYTHNYGCEPGSHLSFNEFLRAADDVGMLVALSQPHCLHYKWDSPDAERSNGYARDAAFYVRVAGNHPAVVMYSMNHNALSYQGDFEPRIDRRTAQRRGPDRPPHRSQRPARPEGPGHRRATRPPRVVYHHSSGNLGNMHTNNLYLDFVPVQERSDWFEHWATEGTKPLLLCEYGVPWDINWTMYRGWYKGVRSWGSAPPALGVLHGRMERAVPRRPGLRAQ